MLMVIYVFLTLILHFQKHLCFICFVVKKKKVYNITKQSLSQEFKIGFSIFTDLKKQNHIIISIDAGTVLDQIQY